LFFVLLKNRIDDEIIPIIENDHGKQLTTVQKDFVVYTYSKCLKINNYKKYDVLFETDDVNQIIKWYKEILAYFLLNRHNNNIEKVINYKHHIDNSCNIAFLQLLTSIFYFEDKEFTGSKWKQYEKSLLKFSKDVNYFWEASIIFMKDYTIDDYISQSKKCIDKFPNGLLVALNKIFKE